jgi:flavin reductase (DIM6/NTAB) family NADH-FMN oxidoreductase RutF
VNPVAKKDETIARGQRGELDKEEAKLMTRFATEFDLSRTLNREVWVVTAAAAGRRGGLTATWVVPASLNPDPLRLLVGFGPNHFTTELVQASGQFVAHLLREDQADLAWEFARDSSRHRDKLSGLQLESYGPHRAPVLRECLACWECRVIATYSTGDRLLVWGEAVASGTPSPQASLGGIWGGQQPLREQAFFSSLNDEQRRVLKANREADLAELQSLHDAWRRSVQS